MTILLPSDSSIATLLVKREDGEIPSLPRSCEWDEISYKTTVLKFWDGKVRESRKIHESENLTSGLKDFRGEGDWCKIVFCDPIFPIGMWGFLVAHEAEFSSGYMIKVIISGCSFTPVSSRD